MVEICSHRASSHRRKLVHRHHRPRRTLASDLLQYEEYQIRWPPCIVAQRPEPPAGILLPGGRIIELGRIRGIIVVFVHPPKLSLVLRRRTCLDRCRHDSSGVMDCRRRSATPIPEHSKEGRAHVVMSPERESHQHSRELCFDLYRAGSSPHLQINWHLISHQSPGSHQISSDIDHRDRGSGRGLPGGHLSDHENHIKEAGEIVHLSSAAPRPITLHCSCCFYLMLYEVWAILMSDVSLAFIPQASRVELEFLNCWLVV